MRGRQEHANADKWTMMATNLEGFASPGLLED